MKTKSKRYGYVRVSSRDQNEARQIKALLKIGIERKNIYVDKISGVNFDRPEYIRLIKKMRKEDVLFIKSIDRLGRDYQEILVQWKFLTHHKKIDIVVLDMPLLDTRKEKDLLGTFISDLVLQVLAYGAEMERQFSKERQREGIEVARENGVKFGRPRKTTKEMFCRYYEQLKIGSITRDELMEKLDISKSTYYRCYNEWIKKDKVA